MKCDDLFVKSRLHCAVKIQRLTEKRWKLLPEEILTFEIGRGHLVDRFRHEFSELVVIVPPDILQHELSLGQILQHFLLSGEHGLTQNLHVIHDVPLLGRQRGRQRRIAVVVVELRRRSG